MLKNHIKKKVIISILSLFILSLIYIIPVNKKYDEEVIFNSETNYLYLLNNNKLVRTSSISNDSNIENRIKEIIESLTIGSNKQNYIDNNYQPLIPNNTKLLDFSINEGLLKINFSKELLDVSIDNEEKMIESLIYSLTELSNVNKIIIYVENELLTKLPKSNKEIPHVLTRNYGINKIYDINTISNINKVTLYYYININNKYNAVPVTLFTNDSKDKVEIIIKELKSSLSYQTDLVSFLSNNASLLDYEIEENKVKINFSSYILDDFFNDSLIEEVKYAISSSIKDSLNVSSVSIFVNGNEI